jgi:hypothetical protein
MPRASMPGTPACGGAEDINLETGVLLSSRDRCEVSSQGLGSLMLLTLIVIPLRISSWIRRRGSEVP